MKRLLNITLILTLSINSALYCAAKTRSGSTIQIVRDRNSFDVDVIKSSKPSVVKFYSDSCGPCKRMKPIFEALATELSTKYNFVEINTATTQGICDQYNIRSIPTFIYFKNGKEVKRSTGSMSQSALKSEIESNLN